MSKQDSSNTLAKIRDGKFPMPDLTSLPPDGGDEYNRLIFESSPYLLQHARNPVDWFPWGEEAFQRAERENKPIFLSIGYSTCHWCHVMEHESFIDPEIAAFLKERFISIKVDREERPDIDHIYMTVTQAMTGSGGWPMTIFMTPKQKPFFAGTYFPKESRYDRPGFLNLLQQIDKAWNDQREKIEKIGMDVQRDLFKWQSVAHGEALDATILPNVVQAFRESYDARHGGFGSAPKFPLGHSLSFLFRQYHRTKDVSLLQMVEHTLVAMYRGGLYDHIGFGFARYSTDAKWFAPHFEKMLYDNALLLIAYTEASLITKNPFYEKVAREICTYILRDMTDDAGGFYSAENADSEGEEGKFYVWSAEELQTLLGEDYTLACDYFGVKNHGNWETGKNILVIASTIGEIAQRHSLRETDAVQRIERIRTTLFEHRRKRIHPSLDDKIQTSWNGLMIAALAIAGRAFQEPRYLEASIRAVDFILQNRRNTEGRLNHTRGRGEKSIEGFLEDYAYFVWGLIELYESTYDERYLEEALRLNTTMLEIFGDEESGAMNFSSSFGKTLITRTKDGGDGATPSGNSVAAYNCVRLSHLTGDSSLRERGDAIINAFAAHIAHAPIGHSFMLTAFDYALGPSKEIVLAGERSDTLIEIFLRMLRQEFQPRTAVILLEKQSALRAVIPFLRSFPDATGEALAYVCSNYACETPTDDEREFLRMIAD